MKTLALALVVAAAAAPAVAGSVKTVGPKAPIPYAQLKAYSKATPTQRASRDWWSGGARTGSAADVSAIAPDFPTDGLPAVDRRTGLTTEGARFDARPPNAVAGAGAVNPLTDPPV